MSGAKMSPFLQAVEEQVTIKIPDSDTARPSRLGTVHLACQISNSHRLSLVSCHFLGSSWDQSTMVQRCHGFWIHAFTYMWLPSRFTASCTSAYIVPFCKVTLIMKLHPVLLWIELLTNYVLVTGYHVIQWFDSCMKVWPLDAWWCGLFNEHKFPGCVALLSVSLNKMSE